MTFFFFSFFYLFLFALRNLQGTLKLFFSSESISTFCITFQIIPVLHAVIAQSHVTTETDRDPTNCGIQKRNFRENLFALFLILKSVR